MTMPGLLSLPEEVLTAIISCISDNCLANVSQVCRKLNRICSSPLEMRQRCLSFRWWSDHHEFEKKKRLSRIADVNWRALLLYRIKVRLATSRLLDEIISNPTNHINNFNKIVDFGYDAKDCLAMHAEVADDEVDDPLARRYQATAAIRYIHRRRALAIWKRVRDYNDLPLEVALAAFDLFVANKSAPDVEDIIRDIDGLAMSFLATAPEFKTLCTEEKAIKLVHWMWDQGFKGTPAERYRALKNVFVGLTIRTIRTAIPLTLVTIFCAIARRVGLIAHPCGYPGHVLAIVEDPEDGEYQYYDLFPGPGSHPRTDRARLIEGFADDSVASSLVAPATVSNMVIRAAQNIISTLQLPPPDREEQNNGYPEVCEHSTLYAALTAIVLLKQTGPISMHVIEHMTQQIPADFPMDVRFLEEELLPRIVDYRGRTLLENVCGALRAEDTMPRTVWRRDCPENHRVLHRVGSVIKHRRYDYMGAIFGWTNECRPMEGEEWIERMNVETLPRGRNQPFYHVLVEDGTVRYVAEENIQPIRPKNVSALIGLAGKYFKRFDAAEGRFVSNVEAEFPDD
ncbi:Hemimethylated DNA-binding protein YccV like-domain-containing protein [Sphaerosporella brunnea]|uniref:Hemimethylated DNA-binding protein YccV like-domain-containing protein n=1 Tax=Sphaerosporella brunnea TaxID=1250544 RepID=A0A5J5F1U4_9PEZI|nr:Hemimethylated DNA-binding protein YccV like-domain-containing protein [Sphaerosporella brunnea]